MCLIVIILGTSFSMFAGVPEPQADTSSYTLKVYFRQGYSRLEMDYLGNRERVLDFMDFLHSADNNPDISFFPEIEIRSAASPEGSYVKNDLLSQKRGIALKEFLEPRLVGSRLDSAEIKLVSIGEDWDGLADKIREKDLKYADEAISIIRNTPYWVIKDGKIVGGRKKALMDFRGGTFWHQLEPEVFPELRTAALVTVFYKRARVLAPVTVPEPETVLEPETVPEPVAVSEPVEEPLSEPATVPSTSSGDATVPSTSSGNVAVKTNLLADVATLVNFGVEVPIGDRFSVGADLYFPWWRIASKDITLQLLAGTLEGKYWFGDRSTKAPMTGFYAGAYMGAGLYDFQYGKGIQGELFILGGLSAGYAHEIAKNLRLQYSIGLGYVRTDYRKYEPAKGTKYGDIKVRVYPWEDNRFTGILPTKAEVSLVWMLDFNRKGGGR